jgi:hypothetical protein
MQRVSGMKGKSAQIAWNYSLHYLKLWEWVRLRNSSKIVCVSDRRMVLLHFWRENVKAISWIYCFHLLRSWLINHSIIILRVVCINIVYVGHDTSNITMPTGVRFNQKKYFFFNGKSDEPLTNLKSPPRPLFRPKSTHTCKQWPSPSGWPSPF